MAVVAFTDGRIYAAGINLSGHANQGTLTLSAAELDASVISSGWDVTTMGRKRAALEASGFWEAGTGLPDDLYAKLGVSDQVVTVLPDGDDGGVGYSVQAVPVKYSIGGQAGEILPFSLSAVGSVSRAIRGTVMHDDVTARTATGAGTARQLGAVSATQRVYASLHVLSASESDTLDVVVESDNASNFPSATTRLTFTQATAIGGEWKSAAGAITDDWWRVSYTIGGSSPSFQFVVVIAIH